MVVHLPCLSVSSFMISSWDLWHLKKRKEAPLDKMELFCSFSFPRFHFSLSLMRGESLCLPPKSKAVCVWSESRRTEGVLLLTCC